MSPFAGYSDNIKSTEDIMQDVLSSIYSHVKLCANEKAIEVSYDAADAKTFDSMNEMLYGRRRVTETSEIVSDHGNVNKTFSAILDKLFSFHNQNLSSPYGQENEMYKKCRGQKRVSSVVVNELRRSV